MLELRPYQQDLYTQVKNQFKEGKRRVLVVSPCGSGKTAIAAKMMQSTLDAHPVGECLMLVHRRELLRQHIDTLAGYGVDTSRIRVESVFTEVKRLEKHSKPLLLILDEAHLSKAASWEKVVQHYDTWTVGLSATPCRLDNRPLGDIFESMVQGITHKELERQGRLAPFDYYAPSTVDVSALSKQSGDYAISEVEDLVCTRTVYGDVLRSYKRFADGRRTIAFCVSVRHSKEIADLFNDAGIPAASLDGSMSKSARADIMDKFRSGTIQVLASCNIISEGISVDECDCCLLLRPTESVSLYIQQSCRCLRYLPGKRAVILDMVGNYTRHGLPDSDREYSLNSNIKSIREYNPDGSLTLRVCAFCFKTFKTAPICPFCGESYEPTPLELKQMSQVELKRIEAEKFEAERVRKEQVKQDIRNARTFDDFLKIAKKNSYANPYGWASIRMKCRERRGR